MKNDLILGSLKVASDLINKGFCKNPMKLLCRLFKLTQSS